MTFSYKAPSKRCFETDFKRLVRIRGPETHRWEEKLSSCLFSCPMNSGRLLILWSTPKLRVCWRLTYLDSATPQARKMTGSFVVRFLVRLSRVILRSHRLIILSASATTNLCYYFSVSLGHTGFRLYEKNGASKVWIVPYGDNVWPLRNRILIDFEFLQRICGLGEQGPVSHGIQNCSANLFLSRW